MKEFDKIDILGNEESADMKSYISRLVSELREDIEVYEQLKSLNLTVGEVRENIARLTDYKDDYNYCKKCPGIDECGKKTPHISMHVHKDGNYLQCEYEPCKKIMEKVQHDAHYLVCDFPDEWKNSSLKTLDISELRKPVIKQFAKILNGDSARWIYLKGNHKVGKSFLLVTFANEYVALNYGQVAVINASNRIKDLADLSYDNKEEFTKQMVALSNVPLLVIDDFGEEYKNEYIRDNIILPLLSEREHHSRLTFFSSEFSLDEIQQLYSVGKNSGEIRGKQLANILREMCEEEYDVTGTSVYRK